MVVTAFASTKRKVGAQVNRSTLPWRQGAYLVPEPDVGHSKPSITLDVYGEPWDDSQEQLATKLDEVIRAEMVA